MKSGVGSASLKEQLQKRKNKQLIKIIGAPVVSITLDKDFIFAF